MRVSASRRAASSSFEGSMNLPRIPPSDLDEALLGFDAREMFMDPARTWESARREMYLLRTNAPKPLSVDSAVWPSLFGEGLSEAERKRLRLDTMKRPEWTGPNQNLWEDLARMESALGPLAATPHCNIAIAWVSADGFSKPAEGPGPYREKMTPATRNADWVLLGYDVADSGFISGLSNCRYDPAEVAALRGTWSSHLNEHHLFADVDKALAFKGMTERRVPEHAQFFVFGLWLISQT